MVVELIYGAAVLVIAGYMVAALLRPDMFTAVALLSVPYSPPSVRRPTEMFAEMTGHSGEFYINYFQQPGRAEAEAGE